MAVGGGGGGGEDGGSRDGTAEIGGVLCVSSCGGARPCHVR